MQVSVNSFNQPHIQYDGAQPARGRWMALIAQQGAEETMRLLLWIFFSGLSGQEITLCVTS